MSTPQPRKRLPVKPSEENLRKQAKRLAKASGLPLSEAQHALAKEYGAKHWAELMHIVETMLRGADQVSSVKYEMEALPKAANANDIERVRAILASGEFTQHDLDLALARSVLRFDQRGAIARLLLEHGADPDGQYGSGYGPIIFGTGECLDVEGLRFLIDAGADVTFAPIDTKYGRHCPLSYWLGTYVRGKNARKHEGIQILLDHGAHIPPEVTPEILAIHRGDATRLGEMLDADRSLLRKTYPDMPYGNILLQGATLLHCAVEFGEIECIDAILSRYRGHGDLDMNSRADVIDGVGGRLGGQTPIYHAINTNCDGNFHVLEYLIRRNGQYIDMGVKATWRMSDGTLQATPLTPLEYAEKAEREIDPKWAHFRPRVKDEIALLRPLDRRATIRKAAEAGDVDAVRSLLDAHPDLLTGELWPGAIHKAKSLELVRLLLDRGLDPNDCPAPRKPLHLATYYHLADIVELLIERGADVNHLNRLDETPLDLIGEYEPHMNSSDDARRCREALLKAGAKHNFHTAIRAGELALIRQMLDADPQLVNTTKPWSGLFTAARTGQLEAAKLLLARGAKVDGPNDRGNTPLWFACQSSAPAKDRIAVAKLLLEHGANPRRECEDRSTPLHYAAWRGPRAMVELLIRHNAKTWQADKDGKLPIDYARDGVATDKDAIVHLLDRPVIDDPHFRAAVTAIQSGDIETLQRLLREHPNLSRDRAVEPDCYLASDYFGSPKLLWFVANNPTLMKSMPANIVQIASAIIDAGVDEADLTYTLELVMTSSPARDQNLQQPLMELLLSRGAKAAERAMYMTLGHGMVEPVRLLLSRGMPLSLPVAAALGDEAAVTRLLPGSDPDTLHAAFSLAVINRQTACVRLCLDAGADINRRLIVHAHSSASHQAVANNDLPTLQLLIERGANLHDHDDLWDGNPIGWAIYLKHPQAEAMLRAAMDASAQQREKNP